MEAVVLGPGEYPAANPERLRVAQQSEDPLALLTR